MDYNTAFAVSAAGMNLERTRVDVAALNLANANTPQVAGAQAFRPMRVLAQSSMGGPTFAAALSAAGESGSIAPAMLPAAVVEPSTALARKVYDAGHPMADAQGFVTYPAVDPAAEMVTLMSAARAYEANVAAMNTARTLALKTLEIGGAS